MNNEVKKGYFLTFISAVIFGFTPTIARLTYNLGNNGITMAFFRHLFVIPLLLLIIKAKGYSLKLTREQFKHICKVGIIGNGLTVIMLYSSYSYIQVGSATVLHFMYPMFVCLISSIYFKDKLSKSTIVCLIIATIGITFFIEVGGSMLGILLSLGSGIFFAYYVVGVDKLGLKDLNPYVLNFYFAIVIALSIGIVGMITNQLILLQPGKVYLYALVVAVLASIVAIICLQQGIKRIGGTKASIVSMFEPVTSIIFGLLFLNEQLSLFKMIGCILILGSIIYMIKATDNK